MTRPVLTFPAGAILPGVDLLVTAIPVTEASWNGGLYEEYDSIEAYGQTWIVLEWCFEHNCFIATPDIHDGYTETQLHLDVGHVAAFEFHRRVWGDVPTGKLHESVTALYQQRMF
jgi:hypothetical protein